jgi:hypothetical protein
VPLGFAVTRAMRSIALAALVSSVLACANAAPARVVVQSRVSVVVLPSPDALPFDPNDARLAEASAQLSALAGHPLVFEFDVALLPDWRADFQQMLIESIESVARDLDRLGHEEPRVFSHGAPLIERIVSRYDVQVAHRPEWKLDPAARVLRLTGPATHWGIERGYVVAALEDEYARWADERWGSAHARDVAPSDRPAYFEFLTDSCVRAAWTKRHGRQGEGAPREPDVDAVLGAVELSSVLGTSAPPLARDVRAWLVHQVQELADAYNGEEDRVIALPPSSPWHRAEAAWVAWANAQLGTMSDEEKLVLVGSVFVRTRGPDGVFRASATAFPGFDRFAFGLSVADSWARVGHPRGGAQPEAQRALIDIIVCPRTVGPDGTESMSSRCDYVWYRDAIDAAATTKRLTDALLARKDRDLVQTAFSAVAGMPSGGDKLALLLSLLHALDGDDLAWTEAFRVIADELAEGGDSARWIDEARRVWGPHPSRRGAALCARAGGPLRRQRQGRLESLRRDLRRSPRCGRPGGVPRSGRAGVVAGARRLARSLAGLVASRRHRASPRRVPRRSARASIRRPGPGACDPRHRGEALRRGQPGGHGADGRGVPQSRGFLSGRDVRGDVRGPRRVREARDGHRAAGAQAPDGAAAVSSCRPIALVLVALFVAACGGASTHAMVVSNDVTIAITPAITDLPFDPRSARLAQASQQLTQALGHPIALRIDAALVPPFRSSLETALAESIEHIARDVASLRRDRPGAFAHEAPLFRSVDCRYVAAAERVDGRFDAAAGTVVVREAGSSAFVDEGVVQGALEDDYRAWLDGIFSKVAPEAVPRERWEEYFQWAGSTRPTPEGRDGRSLGEKEKFDGDPRGVSLAVVARFARVAGAGDGALARRIDEHLVHEMYYLLLAYENDAALVRQAGTGSVFRRAEAAWVDWFKWRLPALDDRSKVTVAERIFGVGSCDACVSFAERFPGLDGFGWGLDVADAWARAGHPTGGSEGDAHFELMDLVVCPVLRLPGGKHERNRGCGGGWFELALKNDALTHRLAAALGQRGDDVLVETLFANFKYGDAVPVLTLWRALAAYARAWHVAARVVIEELLDDGRKKSEIVAEGERVWAAMIDRRGTALYLMARADSGLDPYYADDRWGTFGKRLGGEVGPAVFAAMLDESVTALKVAHVVWPALSKGWSRGDVVVARMDRFLDEPSVSRGEDGEPGQTLRAIVKRMCTEGAAGDVVRVHAYLVQRAARSAASSASLGTLVADTDAGRCGRAAGR